MQGGSVFLEFQERIRFFYQSLQEHQDFELRDSQVEMSEALALNFLEMKKLFCEAPTGVGKTLGYLVPAVLWAYETGCTVVIATKSIALEHQIVERFLPQVQEILGVEVPVAYAKGWSQFLCLFQWSRMQQSLSPEEARHIETLFIEDEFLQLENVALDRDRAKMLACDSKVCTYRHCQFFDRCGYFLHRNRVPEAQVIVTTHAFLFYDYFRRNKGLDPILPDMSDLIIDEAHRLPSQAEKDLTQKIESGELFELCDSLFQWLSLSYQDAKLRSQKALIQEHQDLFQDLMKLKEFWESMTLKVSDKRVGIYEKHWSASDFLQEVGELGELDGLWGKVIASIDAILEDSELEPLEVQQGSSLKRRFSLLKRTLKRFLSFSQEDEEFVAWASLDSFELSLSVAPIDLSQSLQDSLWGHFKSLCFTSATMAVSSEMDAFVQQVGVEGEFEALTLEAPFDYESRVLVLLPKDPVAIDPKERGFEEMILGLSELIREVSGKTLILTTSYAQIEILAEHLGALLSGVKVLCQGETSNSLLLQQFLDQESSVLLGTEHFWEGVDIDKDSLRLVVIARLPFPVPHKPREDALVRKWREQEGYRSLFKERSLPQAVLRFRQGFGRLMRHQDSGGAVLVLDPRLTRKSYGARFIESLPGCRLHRSDWPKMLEMLKAHCHKL